MKKQNLLYAAVALLALSLVFNFVQFSRTGLADKYPLLAKRLFVSNPNDLIINFTPLRQQLREYVAKADHKIGIYFEYLPTGTSVNINGNEEFYRASLVKLPGIMRTYKLIEDDKLREDELLEIKDYHFNNFFGPEDVLKVGMKKTVGELAALSLRDSNNTAYEVIYERVNGEILQKAKDQEQTVDDVYDYLDIPISADGQTLFISPKNYSSVLKSLYFSAYLNYADSSKLLENLTHSSFNDWLPKPLPTDLRIAHKFGVFDLIDPPNYKVHSDCGIFYLPQRPYVLCVMGQHTNNNQIGSDISDISKTVYDYTATAD